MSEPTSPEEPGQDAERLHPLFLLTGLGGSLRGIAGGYAAIGYLAVSGQLRTALIGAVALLAVLVVSVLVHWLRFSFRVGEFEIRIDSGIISRTHRSIPFDRVHDVDITQGPVARLFGIAKVKFETGSAAAGNADEGVLQAIPLARAEQIRQLIRARRTGLVAEAEVATADEGEPVFAMPLPRVMLAGVFNFSLALFAGLFGLSQTVGDVVGFDPLNRAFWRQMLSVDNPIAGFVLEHRVATVAAGLVVLVLAGIVTGIVRTGLREYGFRLERTGSGLRRRRGLFTKTDVTIPARRAQAAILASGPVRSAFGWSELRLQSLASDEGGKGDHVLAPLASDTESARILEALSWPPVRADTQWQQVSRSHVATLAIGLTPLLVGGLVQAVMLPIAGAAIVGVYFSAIGSRWLSWRRTHWAIDGDRLLLRSGWWRRRTIILPLRNVQSVDLVESAISRLFGTASLLLGVAGGRGFSAHRVPALTRETARQLRWRLLG